MPDARYQRVLLKLSGEALTGDQAFGISQEMLAYTAAEIQSIVEQWVSDLLLLSAGVISSGVWQQVPMAWNEPRLTTWGCWRQL